MIDNWLKLDVNGKEEYKVEAIPDKNIYTKELENNLLLSIYYLVL